MGLDEQIDSYCRAGLISAEQAARIREYERLRARPTLLYAAAALAGLAVAIGLVAIVAANWDEIPGRAKIAVDLIGLGVLGTVVTRHGRGGGLREAGLVVLHGAVLASIALVAQVYQTGGSLLSALAFWSVLSLPALWLGRSGALATIWILGLELSYWVACEELAARRGHYEVLGLAAAYWAPLGCIALGRWHWLRERRPALARVALQLGWAELLVFASLGTLAFYGGPGFAGSRAAWLFSLGSLAATAALVWRTDPGPGRRAVQLLLCAALLVSHGGLLVPHPRLGVLAFIAFLLSWWLVALAAYRTKRRSLLHAATALIGVRLLVAYAELFGTLLKTGVGLVLGGLFALLLIWFWARERKLLDRELDQTMRAPGASEP